MSIRPLVVVTNLTRIGSASTPEQPLEVRPIDEPATLAGALRLFQKHRDADFVLLDGDPEFLFKLCLARIRQPRWAFGGPRLVSLDLTLTTPHNWKEKAKNVMKRLLLANVDHFFHYFRDVTGYRRYFGISEKRSTFIPFKVNGWERFHDRAPNPDGEYIFTSGRSLRDFDTFARAMEITGLPGLLVYHRRNLVAEHGTQFPPASTPANLEIREDDGSMASWLESLDRARVVVVPTLPESIRAVGIGLALTSLGLGKPVVMTESTCTRGVFQDEIITVPPSDPQALAAAIQRVWDDESLRRDLAQRGRRYAEVVGGEAELDTRLRDALWNLCRVHGSGVSHRVPEVQQSAG